MPKPKLHLDRLRARWYYLVLPVALLILGAALWRLAEPVHAVQRVASGWEADTGEYAGAESCRQCHSSIVERQLASNHARTVRDLSREAPLAPFDTGQAVPDPLTGGRYTMETSARGRPEIALTLGGVRASQELAYEFGSGAHAHGYLGRIGPASWIDARLNFYQVIGAWDFTSSQDKPNAYLRTQPLGRPQSAAEAAECFVCHSTVVRVEGKGNTPDGVSVRLRPDRSVLGVTCESCHGPRAEHVRERRTNRPPTPVSRLSADEMNRVCGRCHGLDGVNPSHPVVTRFQPWRLDQSRCFRESEGRLSCVSCHDPHGDAEHGSAFYESKCQGCHSGSSEVAKTVCPVNRKSGCVGCHMPRDAKSMLHITFTDHRIRVLPETKPAAAAP